MIHLKVIYLSRPSGLKIIAFLIRNFNAIWSEQLGHYNIFS
jgi:hypothetical protein